MANGSEIIQTYERHRKVRDFHANRWERMAPYIAPSRVGITSPLSPDDSMMRGVYDSTSIMAAELCAHFIAGNIFNPASMWMTYELPILGRNKRAQDEVNEWLEECRDVNNRNLLASPFYGEAPESLIDWVGFGTGLLMGQERSQSVHTTVRGFRGFHFRAEKTGTFVIVEGVDGIPDTIYREFEMSAETAKKQWPDGTFPESINKAIQDGQGQRTFTFIHCVRPREKMDRGRAGNLGMPWASYYVEKQSKHLIFESGYRRLPGAAFRYQKIGDQPYGRGRGDIAFPDTWTLNSAKRLGLEDWAMKIRPPVLHAHNSVIGSLKLVPGGPTAINTHGKPIEQVIRAFETGGRPEVSQLNEENLRMSLRQIFYIDHILKLLETEKSEMTKYEFAKKVALLYRLIGPVYSRAQSELLYQVAELTWDLQYEAGAFPPPPPAVNQTDGRINVKFHNPIAKAQKAEDAEALVIAFNDIAPMLQIDPSAADRVDLDRAFDEILDIRGVPARWQRSDDEMDKLRAERQKLNEQQMQMDNMEQMAGAAGKMKPMMEMVQGGKK